MDTPERLTSLPAGMPLLVGGDRVVHVDEQLAAAWSPGDRLIVLDDTGDVLHVPADAQATAEAAVTRAVEAFGRMGAVTDEQVSAFYEAFARRLEDDDVFAPIATANAEDVEDARRRGRSTTRLQLSATMRADMVAGLRGWRDMPPRRGQVLDQLDHGDWQVEQVVDGLGVVAFVFEGRPNVFADATGVLRSGNTVVFRIGSDALRTARALVEHALDPALQEAGLPDGAASLVDASSRAAGWAMLSDPRLALAVARGSGDAVSQLGAVARQAGNPVSLHGTGGAWVVAGPSADAARLRATVQHSLDRKVCNTLNTCCIVADRAEELVPALLEGLEAAGAARDAVGRLHVRQGDERFVPNDWFAREVVVPRADGDHTEFQATVIDARQLGHEWEWEDAPEVTLAVVADVDEAVALFNEQSPRFAASLVAEDADEHAAFFDAVDAPFVGDGFTRWVDGQYALGTPELGLSNWETGRLFGRSGILSGDSVYTVRLRATVRDPDLHR